MFKYAFYLALKEKRHEECMIDTTYFLQRKSWNGYELDRIFGIEAPELKERFSKDRVRRIESGEGSYIDECLQYMKETERTVYYYFMGTKYNYTLFSGKLYREIRKKVLFYLHMKGKHFGFSIDAVNLDENAYFDEYFHNSDEHFSFCKETIKRAFVFSEFSNEQNIATSRNMRDENSVAVHIRRTDHLGDNGKLIENGYYRRAIDHIKSKDRSGLVFYVFSDDLEWCQNNTAKIGFETTDRIVFVDWNNGQDSYRDMQLMTYCKHNILAISSFSWWGYYLSNRTNKIVCAPLGYWTEVENHF